MSEKPSSLRELYQANHSTPLYEFLQTTAGKALISALSEMRGNIVCKPTEHETIFQAAEIRGFERAIQSLALLSQPYQPKRVVEQTYGQKPKEDIKKP